MTDAHDPGVRVERRPRDARPVRLAVAEPVPTGWADVARLAERVGADGVPIVLVIDLLVGIVTAVKPRRTRTAR